MVEPFYNCTDPTKDAVAPFLNSHSKAHLLDLAEEFGESTNAIRHELNNLSKAGYLNSNEKGNKIEYRANITHPFYPELQKLIQKYLGIDKIVDQVIHKIIPLVGTLEKAFITGDYGASRRDRHKLHAAICSEGGEDH